MNIDIHHNSDAINKATKVDIAEEVADCVSKELKINSDR